MAEKKKKDSIHDRGGEITTMYTMEEIEKAFHPRSKEKVLGELEDLVNDFSNKHLEKGSIKDADKAADDFIEMFAKYHFGAAFDTIKEDKKQMAKSLEETYGITRDALKKSFQRKGAYRTRRAMFEQHVDPHVDTVDSHKKEEAQKSLNTYLTDIGTRKQVEKHLETRTGRKMSKDNYLSLSDAVNVVSAYMNLPGAEKAIGKPDEQLSLPDEVAGQPGLYRLFEGGEEALKKYQAVPGKVDSTHRFAGKKHKEYKKAA